MTIWPLTFWHRGRRTPRSCRGLHVFWVWCWQLESLFVGARTDRETDTHRETNKVSVSNNDDGDDLVKQTSRERERERERGGLVAWWHRKIARAIAVTVGGVRQTTGVASTRQHRSVKVYFTCTRTSRAALCVSPVFTATGLVNGNSRFSIRYRIDTPEPTAK